MKKIRYLKGNAILVSVYTITKEGVPYTEKMESDPKIQDLIKRGFLEVFDDGTEVQSSSAQSVQEAVVSTLPTETKKPIVEQVEEVVVPGSSEEIPIFREKDVPSVVVQSSEHPALKEVKPLDEAVQQDLEKLKEELEELTQEPIIQPPVQKKS